MIRRTFLSQIAIWTLLFVNSADAREIRVAVSGEMAPFFYRDSSGWHGLSFEVARSVLEKLGHTIAPLKSYPMFRLTKLLRQGKIDIHPNLSPTPERAKIAVFTTVPHISEIHSFISLRGEDISYDGNVGSLNEYRVAAMRGWTHGPNFDANKTLHKIFAKSVVTQVRMLVKGRVHLVVQNPATFIFEARKEGFDPAKFKVLKPPTFELPVFMGISKTIGDAEELRKSLDQALTAFLQTEAYRTILKKFGF